MPEVLNYCDFGGDLPPRAKLVDRMTPFGNPFVMGTDGDRDEVCDKYEAWIEGDDQLRLRQQIRRELRGFHLVCWCAPLRCHAETILRIANAPLPTLASPPRG